MWGQSGPIRQSLLARELVYCLDDRGFLADSAEEMCRYLATEKNLLLALVEKLQKEVEPPGVFAWSLKDCFRIQLEIKDRYDPLIAGLLDRLDLVASQDLEGICTQLGVDQEDAADMLDDIRSLSPAPLEAAPDLHAIARAPDLIFSRAAEDEIDVALNAKALPSLLTDDALFSTVRTAETDPAALGYYRDCYRDAANFVVALQKRANTLLKIGQAIAKTQNKYIRTARALDKRPLTMSGLSAEISLNKSTVSRALRNCLVETEHGQVEALDFLARPLNGRETDRTRDQALQRLSLLIRTENTRAPYTDEDLVRQLSKANFKISRRTVAKYRGILGIEAAHARRKTMRS